MTMPVAATLPNRGREALIEAIIASAEDGAIVIDEASRILLFNTCAERMFGWSAIEVIGQPLEILIPAASRMRHAAFVSDFTGGTVDSRQMSERQDVSALRRDGTEFPVAASITRMRVEGSMFFIAIVRDVSGRHRMAETLAAKTRQLETITAAMTTFLKSRDWGAAMQVLVQGALAETQSEYGFAGVVVDGPVLRILAHAGIIWHRTENRALYETALREYQKQGYLEFRNFNNLFGFVITSGRVVLSNDPAHHAARGGLPAGHPPLSSFLGVPVVSGTETVGIIAVANCPGGYGVRQQAAIELLAQMAGVVFDSYRRSQRERDLEAQFRQAQRMESVGQLAGGIAHDFNNLLTVINGMAEFALTQVPDGGQLHADLQEIRQAAERAATLTRQLLAFSRKQILHPQVMKLNTVVAEMESMLRRLIGEDIDLVVVPTQSLGSVKADPGQMEQVIANLAVNARDAMPQGGKLTIEMRNVEIDQHGAHQHGVAVPPGPYVMLAVSDTGVGMDGVTRTRIFEPFFTTKGPGKGTGLGLSTVYGIVKQSDGFIWVYSEIGQGTSFKIYLPQVADVAGGKRRSSTVAPRHGTEIILVVEDVGGLRKLTKRMLESAGYTVLTAANGEEALRVLERDEPVHLILTDVVMPGMSAGTLAERVHATRPGMKVLYMSGYTDDVIVRHGVLDEGMSFLGKPFTAGELTRKVREVLDSQS